MILKESQQKNEFIKLFLAQFEKTRKENPSLNKFIYEVSLFNNIYIVGGFLRNVINEDTPRDLDMIIGMSKGELDDVIKACFTDFDENRLGGYKIKLEKIAIDVWSIDDNWAFKEDLIKNIKINHIEKIAQGTFFNFDSLVLDLHKLKSSFKYYNSCAINKELDILKKNSKYKKLNPTREANVLRAFYLRAKYGLSYSPQLRNYMIEQLNYLAQVNSNPLPKLLQTLDKYKKYQDLLSKASIEFLINEVYNYPDQKKQDDKNDTQQTLF
ncbi:hypothetical protein SIO70_13635 [Chitinophaga sancti]|uniref:hypothetical protein n=1 Tax=Chitinophaga sancti TaxID=1004 RepID=UPI002A75F2A4|nr:hypothetical protein [Chitinophaga sancti]WPQ65898.1 hypothetical protein SIO70_13635 [Chitinophaga sancti]